MCSVTTKEVAVLIETRQEIDEHKVWDTVWGNDGQGFAYWCEAVREIDGTDFKSDIPHDFKLHDGECWKIVTSYALCKAYADLKAEGWTHCGGYPLDENDACVEDAILQHAMFGEFVYG